MNNMLKPNSSEDVVIIRKLYLYLGIGFTLFMVIYTTYGTQLIALFSPEESKPPKQYTSIAIIDPVYVFQNSKHGRQQLLNIQHKIELKNAELKELSAQLADIKREYDYSVRRRRSGRRIRALLNRFKALEKKMIALQKNGSSEVQQEQTAWEKTFSDELRVVLDQIREEEQLDLIETYDPTKIMSFDPKLNITQKALERIDSLYGVSKTLSAPDKRIK